MCQMNGLIESGECCEDGPPCPPTVECEIVGEACDDVIAAVNSLREAVNEEDSEVLMREDLILHKYIDVQQAIATLTQAVIEYTEPDAGMEPF